MLLRTALLASALLALGASPAAAAAADARLVIRGAGFGHGVGMSQYGALGLAQQGVGYRAILSHYYTGTAIGSAPAGRTIRVLLQSTRGAAAFAGATRMGDRRLQASRTYLVRPRAGALELVSAKGRRLATVAAPLRVSAATPLFVRGRGSYRGALEFRPAGAGVNVINDVALDDYVQGVVPVESPSDWPLEALKAQAVAARTYAVTTSKGGAGFDHYADTRSQVYGGVGVEAASANEAVRQTRGELVTYQGRPAVTYFFSTSGGRTEDVENTPLGRQPVPWLKSVEDPTDRVSPRHRWGPIRMTLGQADRRLGSLVKGAFRGIEVLSRGRSPRVVAADVVGSGGRTRVTGAILRARLGLLDTWAYFTSISTEAETPPAEQPEPAPPADEPPPADPTGGATASRARPAQRLLTGRIVRATRGGQATVELRTPEGWRSAGTAGIGADGRYAFGLCASGAYRVRVGAAIGPVVRVSIANR